MCVCLWFLYMRIVYICECVCMHACVYMEYVYSHICVWGRVGCVWLQCVHVCVSEIVCIHGVCMWFVCIVHVCIEVCVLVHGMCVTCAGKTVVVCVHGVWVGVLIWFLWYLFWEKHGVCMRKLCVYALIGAHTEFFLTLFWSNKDIVQEYKRTLLCFFSKNLCLKQTLNICFHIQSNYSSS